jgi:predicted kinase
MDMIIFIGLQGSGKTTFYQTRFAATHELISKDNMRNHKKPARRQAELVEEALQAHRSIVIDNTNPTLADRQSLIEQGKRYEARIAGYYFDSEVSQSIARNRQREGEAQVPVVAIYTTAKKLIVPSYAEGFDALYEVRIAEDSTAEKPEWVIREWR